MKHFVWNTHLPAQLWIQEPTIVSTHGERQREYCSRNVTKSLKTSFVHLGSWFNNFQRTRNTLSGWKKPHFRDATKMIFSSSLKKCGNSTRYSWRLEQHRRPTWQWWTQPTWSKSKTPPGASHTNVTKKNPLERTDKSANIEKISKSNALYGFFEHT